MPFGVWGCVVEVGNVVVTSIIEADKCANCQGQYILAGVDPVPVPASTTPPGLLLRLALFSLRAR
jgi:hypothetical protein